MPGKDVVVKEAITSVIGTSRLGRRKVIVKDVEKVIDEVKAIYGSLFEYKIG